MNFIRIWLTGIIRPWNAFDALRRKPAPGWGFRAVVLRFGITSITTILALHLLEYRPSVPSYLNLLSAENYYLAEIFFLPLLGIAGWLLSGALVHLLIRATRTLGDIDYVLNVIGFALLIPMPVAWLIDWISIGLGCWQEGLIPVLHSLISLWEICLIAIGLNRIRRVNQWFALLLGFIVKAFVFIPLAMLFIR